MEFQELYEKFERQHRCSYTNKSDDSLFKIQTSLLELSYKINSTQYPYYNNVLNAFSLYRIQMLKEMFDFLVNELQNKKQ